MNSALQAGDRDCMGSIPSGKKKKKKKKLKEKILKKKKKKVSRKVFIANLAKVCS
jgi:hypothetical protein